MSDKRHIAAHLTALQLLLLLTTVQGNSQLSNKPFYSDIPGDFCATRSDPCCTLRQDDCSVPILGTLCYCDEFCNRVVNPDCCPDYSPVCLGVIKPPPPLVIRCTYNGQIMNTNDVITYNCNTCKCEATGKVSCTQHACLIEPQMLDNLQGQQYHWQATNYTAFWGRRRDEGMLHRTGTIEPSYRANRYPVLLHYDPELIPQEFDARTKWPGLISDVMDQGWCGASWAVSTSSVTSDRFSIHSGGSQSILLSIQNLLDCDKKGQQGCEGGRLQRAWNYLWKFGSVLDSCYPYISGATEQNGVCQIKRGTRSTSVSCDSPQLVNTGQNSPIYRTQPAHRINSRVTDIQYEIMTDGPVQAVMRVHQDFFLYRSGVYSYTGPADAPLQYHSVRLIGWGVESTGWGDLIPYWLAVNSWGKDWGEQGLFRIRRGMNESGIEEHIISVRPRLAGLRRHRRQHG